MSSIGLLVSIFITCILQDWQVYGEGCTCKDFVDPSGGGNCRKFSFSFLQGRYCYVEMPSSCHDLSESLFLPGEMVSSAKCGTTTMPTPSPTISPTSPTSPTCKATRTWTQKTAMENCSPGSLIAFGVLACDTSHQSMLEVSIANKLFGKCNSRCVHAYDRIVDGEAGGFLYNRKKKCFKYTTEGRCFKAKRLIRFTARAKKLCKIVL